MSLYLGKIHYWLYDKILWFEEIENEIIQSMQAKYKTMDDLVRHTVNQFGEAAGNEPLEEIIDTSNIHGWLQAKIQSAEQRQAALITELLKWGTENKADLIRIYAEQGKRAAKECEYAETPEELYNAFNDFILEGMPCDRVNQVVKNNPDEYAWITTFCLHKGYWDNVGGDVKNFYDLREAWISTFIQTINPEFKYGKSSDGTNRIIRR